MENNSQQLLELALHAVTQACDITRTVQHKLSQIQSITKADRSPVTVADFAAQAIIANIIRDTGIPLVGEETSKDLKSDDQKLVREAITDVCQSVWQGVTEDAIIKAIDYGNHDATANSYWTLDPVDGTKGFLRGEQYAISLALINNGQVQIGVLGCPNLSADFEHSFSDPDASGLIFYAIKGKGCFCLPADKENATPEKLQTADLESEAAIRVCESVESGHSRHDESARIVEELGGAGIPARLDSQCKYAVVARGQADAYLRLPTRADYVEKIWDHAAGMLVAQEAGMIVTDVKGEPLDFSTGAGLKNNSGVICANPRFHSRIISAIEKNKLF